MSSVHLIPRALPDYIQSISGGHEMDPAGQRPSIFLQLFSCLLLIFFILPRQGWNHQHNSSDWKIHHWPRSPWSRQIPVPCVIQIWCLNRTPFNLVSFQSGIFPQKYKHGLVTQLLKKPNLDKDVLSNYRPVTQLSFVSKILERLGSKQFAKHLSKHHLLSPSQSVYQSGHSTETALLDLQNNILQSAGRGCGTIVVLFDLTAAFDTIEDEDLKDLLDLNFGIRGNVLAWFVCYLGTESDGRTESAIIDGATSKPVRVVLGVPQDR